MISTLPRQAQAIATTASATIVHIIIRPSGEAGVSISSSAAGRNSSSSLLRRGRAMRGNLISFPGSILAGSDDIGDSRLQPVQLGIAPALPDQLVMRAVLDDAAALDGDDPVRPADGRQAVGDEDRKS